MSLPALRTSRAVWIVIAVQFVVMTVCAAAFGTWHDEEYTLATTSHGVSYAVHRAIQFELQPPLYFALLAALRSLSDSVFFARFLSVLCAIAFTYAIALIARRVAPGRDPWIFVALVAFNPYTVFAALEIRLYAFGLLLSALCWLAFYEGFYARESRAARAAFVALALASLYTQYFLAFELLGFSAALIVLRRWKSLRAYALAGIVVAIGFAPMATALHAQVSGALGVLDTKPGVGGSVFLHPSIDFVLPLTYQTIVGASGHALAVISILIVLAAIAVGRPRVDTPLAALIAMALAVEAAYVVVADILHYQLVMPRHFMALFVPEIVCVYAIVASLGGVRARAATTVLVAVIGLSTFASVVTDYRAFAKQGDWPRVGAYLSHVTQPGDTIAIYEADARPALLRYYHGPARVVPFPRALPPDRYDVAAMYVHSERDAVRAFAALPTTGRIWFVDYGGCNRFDRLGCLKLAGALAKHERVLERHAFFQNTVLLVEPQRTDAAPPREAGPGARVRGCEHRELVRRYRQPFEQRSTDGRAARQERSKNPPIVRLNWYTGWYFAGSVTT